jgi:AraC-like DNA-binding protein
MIPQRFRCHTGAKESEPADISCRGGRRCLERFISNSASRRTPITCGSPASELLSQGLSVSTVAYEYGFADQSHLSRKFMEVYGLTPAA